MMGYTCEAGLPQAGSLLIVRQERWACGSVGDGGKEGDTPMSYQVV